MRTLPVGDDPLDERESTSFEEPVDIVSYTDASRARHEWEGTVRAASPDSLEFRRVLAGPRLAGNAPPPEGPANVEIMRLSRVDVVEVEQRVAHGEKAAFVVLGAVLVIYVLAAIHAKSAFDLKLGRGWKSAGG